MAKGLRLLFLSYWSAEEPLVRSTILPYLKLMSEGREATPSLARSFRKPG